MRSGPIPLGCCPLLSELGSKSNSIWVPYTAYRRVLKISLAEISISGFEPVVKPCRQMFGYLLFPWPTQVSGRLIQKLVFENCFRTTHSSGYQFTIDRDRLWSKNLDETENPVCKGINLGVNFNYDWEQEKVTHSTSILNFLLVHLLDRWSPITYRYSDKVQSCLYANS